MKITGSSGQSRLTTLLGLLAAALLTAAVLPSPALAAPTPVVVKNAGFESISTAGFPTCWQAAGSGTSTHTTGSVTPGRIGGKAMSINMTAYTSGERAFRVVQSTNCGPPVIPGHQYDLSLWYTATSPNVGVKVSRLTSAGWVAWQDLAALPPTPTYQQFTVRTPVVPPGTTAISFGGFIYGVGTLTVDDVAMVDVDIPPLPGQCSSPGPECKGSWQVLPFPAAVRGIHVVLLNNGKLLLIAGSGTSKPNFTAGTFTTSVFDPVTGAFTSVPTPVDMFCAGHVQLPDGRVLVVGGTLQYPTADGTAGYTGLAKGYVFDPASNTYQQTNDLLDGHWYPSATVLGNGDVLSAGGHTTSGLNVQSTIIERWSNAQQRWLALGETVQTNRSWGSYPALTLMQDGRLFYTGARLGKIPNATGAEIYNYDTGTRTDVPGLQNKTTMLHAMSVLLPPAQDQRVLTMGGNGTTGTDATRRTDLIDLKKVNPKYVPGPLLPIGTLLATGAPLTATQGKMYVSAVLLPDGKVFETGGSLHLRADDVAEASMFDPATNTFIPGMATDPVGRSYHSSAVLLPDGRVMTFGSSPGNGTFELRISVYSPPYLFRGARPVITNVQAQNWAYGSMQQITVDSPVISASLIRPAAVTHSSDPNQRSVDLPMTVNGNTLGLHLTTNPNIAPPGWYMLFVAKADGTTSEAKWVHVG